MIRRLLRFVATATIALALLLAGLVLVLTRMPGLPEGEGKAPPAAVLDPLVAELETDIRVLASEIGERHVPGRPLALQRAASHIRMRLEDVGLAVTEDSYFSRGHEVAILTSEIGGAGPWLVIGAHYDSVPGTPGADDNASGVAALLALAGRLASSPPPHPVRLVAFPNEEPPHFRGPEMGSRVAARLSAERAEPIRGMLSLETLGYFSDASGSQAYPQPFGLLYPSQGNFVAFVSNIDSLGFNRRLIAAFRHHATIPSEGAALPASVPGVDWSDHASYWHHGWPAVMVTDTAPFRNPHYHETTDVPGTLDLERLARVVLGLEGAIRDLGP